MADTDRELLELAAKAAGHTDVEVLKVAGQWMARTRDGVLLNYLHDDGDALRLAVKLRLQVTPGTYLDQAATAYGPIGAEAKEHVHYQQDMLAATRRAIVRAAAAIAGGQQRASSAEGAVSSPEARDA